jgi:hypothetical protein
MIPGWPYSFVAALGPGRSSWTRLLDAVRIRPCDDLTQVTAAQVREVVQRIIDAGHWHEGDPDILVIFDAGYEPARLAWLLADLPVQVLGRLGSNRVLRHPAPPRQPGQMGRPVRHGPEFRLAARAHPGPDVTTTTQTTRYGTAIAAAWHRLHPKLHARGAWAGHQGELPVIEGTLIKLTVDHLPHDHHPKAVPGTQGRARGSATGVPGQSGIDRPRPARSVRGPGGQFRRRTSRLAGARPRPVTAAACYGPVAGGKRHGPRGGPRRAGPADRQRQAAGCHAGQDDRPAAVR